MTEKIFETALGPIHYWLNLVSPDENTLVFLPGLTADHRLFDKQIGYFEGKFNVFVWDARGTGPPGPLNSGSVWRIRRPGWTRF